MLLSLPAFGDPLLSYQFTIEVTGAITLWGYFTEVSGIASEVEMVEYKIFDPNTLRDKVIKVPGRWKPGEITLRRGITTNMKFWDWHEKAINARAEDCRAKVVIEMYNRAHMSVVTWELTNAWPSQISGPELKSDSSDVGIEEVTLQYEEISREGGGLLAAIASG